MTEPREPVPPPPRGRRLRIIRRFLDAGAPGYLFRPGLPFRAKRVTRAFLESQLIDAVAPRRDCDRFERSSAAPWVPDRVDHLHSPDGGHGTGHKSLELARLEAEINAARGELNWLLDRVEDAREHLHALPTDQSWDTPVTYAVGFGIPGQSALPIPNAVEEAVPRVVRPIMKQYPALTGSLVDILL